MNRKTTSDRAAQPSGRAKANRTSADPTDASDATGRDRRSSFEFNSVPVFLRQQIHVHIAHSVAWKPGGLDTIRLAKKCRATLSDAPLSRPHVHVRYKSASRPLSTNQSRGSDADAPILPLVFIPWRRGGPELRVCKFSTAKTAEHDSRDLGQLAAR